MKEDIWVTAGLIVLGLVVSLSIVRMIPELRTQTLLAPEPPERVRKEQTPAA
jgi:hypothetical protein